MQTIDLIKIGRTQKPFGLDGGLKVAVRDEYLEDFLQIDFLFIEQKGQPVPFYVESIEGGQLIVYLEDIKDKDAAEAVAKKEISIQAKDIIPEEERMFEVVDDMEYSYLVGYTMIDEKLGKLGKIEELVAYPQQEMANIVYEDRDILIPLNDSFIQSVDEELQIISVILPEGIIDMQL